MALIRDLSELQPKVLERAREWLSRLETRRIDVLVTETRRTMAVAEAYYARGRRTLAETNRRYEAAGLRPVTLAQNQSRITNARPGRSWHIYGCALDFVPLVDGAPDWSYDPASPSDFWDEIAHEAESVEFAWGGRWRSFPDRPHLEYHPGWTRVADAHAWMIDHGGAWSIPLLG